MPGFITDFKKNIFIRNMRNMTPLIFSRENALSLTAGFVLSVGNTALNIATPYLLSKTVETLNSDEEYDIFGLKVPAAMLYASCYGLAWTVGNITSNFRGLAVGNIGPNIGEKITERYIDHVTNQSASHNKTLSLSDHISRITKSNTSLPSSTTGLFTQILPTAMEVGAASTILSYLYGAPIGIGLAAVSGAYTIYELATKQIVTKARKQAVSKNYHSNESIVNLISHYEAMHMFNNIDFEKKKLHAVLMESKKANGHVSSILAKLSLGQSLITGAGCIGILLYVIDNVRLGKYTVEDLVLITTYLVPFLGSLNSFGVALNQFVSDVKDLDPVFKEIEFPSEIADNNKWFELMRDTAKIEFKNVSYSYHDNTKVFDNISFTVKPGQKVGIVGISGSGKSTLVKLLERFIEPTNGEIIIYGQNIKDVGLKYLREHIGSIPQKPVIFNDTLYNNIAYAHLSDLSEIDEYEIEKIIKDIGLDEYVKNLPSGINTIVGENGVELSEGQKKLVSVARLFLKNPYIVVADEPTASLDNNAAKIVQESIDKQFRETTTILITNRLYSLLNADNIIVIHEGKVAQQGTHDELIQKSGVYSDLWMKYQNMNKSEYKESKKLSSKKEKQTNYNISSPVLFTKDKTKHRDLPQNKTKTKHKRTLSLNQ